ncbi:MAG: DsrE/DsrF/DrsH-like family protein [Candidatus Firestonebacteria bacterium]
MAEENKMTIILFSGEMDKALAAFTLATTAGSMGFKVTMFFTFWGLNVLKKGGLLAKKTNFLQKMFAFMNRGTKDSLPLSKFNFSGAGPAMMKLLMTQKKMASLPEMMKLAKELGVKFEACTTSCNIMGVDREALIDEVDEMVGAASYLGDAKNSNVNLFI